MAGHEFQSGGVAELLAPHAMPSSRNNLAKIFRRRPMTLLLSWSADFACSGAGREGRETPRGQGAPRGDREGPVSSHGY